MAGAVLRDNRIAACASHLSLKFPSGILPALPRNPSMTGCSSSNWLRRSLLGTVERGACQRQQNGHTNRKLPKRRQSWCKQHR